MRSGIVENMSCTMDDFVYIHELWFIDFSCMYVCLLLKCQALDLLLSPVCVCVIVRKMGWLTPCVG